VTYVSHEAREYQELVKASLLEHQKCHRSTGRIAYRMVVCPRSNREQDISNRIKVLEDALQHANLFNNDSQVDQIEVRRGPVVAGGAVKISVWELVPDYTANLLWAEVVG
jgi:crossover junction endodeoxyribonuclease RusA